MKRVLHIAIFTLLIAATVFSQEIQTEHYDFKDYDKIEVNNSIYVTLVARNQEGVSVSCDDRLMPAMQVKKMGDKLSISIDWDKVERIVEKQENSEIIINDDRIIINDENKFRGGLKVTVNVKNVTEIEAISAGMVKWEGDLPTKKLRLITSSAGSIKWDGVLELDELDMVCSSAGSVLGDLKLKNAAIALNSAAKYSGDIDVETLVAEISSAANFQGNVNASRAKFDLDAVSNAKITGSIDTLHAEANTSSNLSAQELVYQYAEVKTDTYGVIYLSKSGKVVDNTPRSTGVIIE
ncbi:MAG: hypothetical protein CSA95_02510 [Bacteroidetes bacterium]|nr:MAG: hypothetical protein CSA95_02510 [Bacteroidota bacterium]